MVVLYQLIKLPFRWNRCHEL